MFYLSSWSQQSLWSVCLICTEAFPGDNKATKLVLCMEQTLIFYTINSSPSTEHNRQGDPRAIALGHCIMMVAYIDIYLYFCAGDSSGISGHVTPRFPSGLASAFTPLSQ